MVDDVVDEVDEVDDDVEVDEVDDDSVVGSRPRIFTVTLI